MGTCFRFFEILYLINRAIFSVETSSVAAGFGRHGMPPPVCNPFDVETGVRDCESHLRWGTFIPNLGTLGHWVIELFTIHATDGQTDKQTDGRTKATLIGPFLRLGHNNIYAKYAVINVSQKTRIYLSNFRIRKVNFIGTRFVKMCIYGRRCILDLYIPDAEGFDRVSRTVAAPGCQSWAGGQGGAMGRQTYRPAYVSSGFFVMYCIVYRACSIQ